MANKQTAAQKKAAAEAAEQEATEAQEEQGEGRTKGYDALPPVDRFSASQPHPFAPADATISKNAYEAVPDDVKQGSVLPYMNDEIDVDSADSRVVPLASDGTPIDPEAAEDNDQKEGE